MSLLQRASQATTVVRRRPLVFAAAGLVALLVVVTGAVVAWQHVFGGASRTITARFTSTPGLYVGNRVDILGIAKGEVTGVTPHGKYVEVRMSLPTDIKVPAHATAAILAPNPVSDRVVELYPPYTSGPVMRDGALIPLTRTAVPLSIDAIFANLDTLAKGLGPNGANKNGALSDVIKSAADLTQGTGANLRTTLKAISQALPAFTSNPAQLKALLIGLDRLTALLAAHDSTLDSVFDAVTTATSQIAGERKTIESAIANLQSALVEVVRFVRANKANVSSSLKHLLVTSEALISDQAALRKTFSTAALGFQNFNRTIDLDAPCTGERGTKCPAAFARVDLPIGSGAITSTYCRDLITTFVPFLTTIPGVKNVNQALRLIAPPTTLDSDCLSQHALVDGWDSSSPGAPALPNLGLSEFLR
jgi:phospholipid/cholesterol/gamma-HCH transport system substrate-binding protein